MKRIVQAVLLVLIAAGAVAGGLYYRWLQTPPPMPQTMDQALEVLHSPRYTRLDDARKEAYLEKSRTLFFALSAEERQALQEQLRDNPALRDAARQATEDYMFKVAMDYSKADPARRQQMLDAVILMSSAMGPGTWGRSGKSSNPDSPEAQQERAARMSEARKHFHERVEKGNPQKQQLAHEFMKDMMARRQALGMDPMPRPPHR